MLYTSQLGKMRTELTKPINYWLKTNEGEVLMNDLIGKELQFKFAGIINCIICDRSIKKVFGQGSCYPCFINSPYNSECIIHPELCLGHEGKGRDPEWEKKNHVIDHTVYLALTSAVKVGITSAGNENVRWVDQGAWQTIKLANTPDRYTSGLIEVALKEFVTDKTNWQRMLKDERKTGVDLLEVKDELIDKLPEELQDFISDDDEVIEITYPVNEYPQKIKSVNFDKTPELGGKLIGIRAQYLIFEGGIVINIRKFSGYNVSLTVSEGAISNNEQVNLF
jgi:hypothetical protein